MPIDPITAPILAALALLAIATALGAWPIIKLITVYEAKHGLREGSAGWLRNISGWSLIAFWLMATWFCATVIGDWAVSGDLQGAGDRAILRLLILIDIAMAIAEADG